MNDLILSPIRLDELGALIERYVTKGIQSQPKSMEGDKYVSINEAVSVIGVSRPTLYECFKDGRLTKYKLGGMTRVLLSEVLALVEPVTT